MTRSASASAGPGAQPPYLQDGRRPGLPGGPNCGRRRLRGQTIGAEGEKSTGGQDASGSKAGDGASAAETHDLENTLDDLTDAARSADSELTVEDLLDAFAQRSFGALLTVAALVAALPLIGAIPGVSIVTGALILLISVQMLLGRRTPWTPQRLRRIPLDAETLEKAVEKTRPVAAWIDGLIKPRLAFLADGAAARTAIALASIGLAVLFFPLALIPGGVWPPSLAIVALGLALVANDGVLTLIGAAGAAGTLALLVWAL